MVIDTDDEAKARAGKSKAFAILVAVVILAGFDQGQGMCCTHTL
jgi:hypothetical protein